MNSISIIIPTYKFTKYLDQAIESCLNLKYVDPNIYVNINSQDNNFKESIFWSNKKIKWRYIKKTTENQYESVNDAVLNSKGEWIYILSDDDLICSNFLKNIDISNFNQFDIYASRLEIINESNTVVRTQKKYFNAKLNSNEAMNLFFKNKFYNHLSLFVFSRKSFNKIGGYTQGIYPNGYYLDTIFHAKLIANCNNVYFSDEINFKRRETQFQGSSKFYYHNVNNYFNDLINKYYVDNKLKIKSISYFGSKENHLKNELQNRLKTELIKIFFPIYDISLSSKFSFFYQFLMFWRTGVFFKIKILIALPFIYIKIKIRKIITSSS